MSRKSQISSPISRRYAIALLDLAEESKVVEKIEKDLDALFDIIHSSQDFLNTIRNPLVSRGNKQALIAEISKKAGFEKLTENFLGVLAQNRRLNALESIIHAVKNELSQRRGEVIAHVKVAQDLSDTQVAELQKALSEAEGKKVTVRVSVEPSIMGGMIVTVGSRMIDDSVRGKLAHMKAVMEQASVNENNVQNLSKAG